MAKKPWNPKWLPLIAFCFSFLVAGVVAGFNYGRLGRPEKKKKVIMYTIIGFIATLLITAVLPPLPYLLFVGINVGVGAYLAREQKFDYISWKSHM